MQFKCTLQMKLRRLVSYSIALMLSLLAPYTVLSAVAGKPTTHDVHVARGHFSSAADARSFQAALDATLINEVKISNPDDNTINGDGAPNDNFGVSVAISGDTALVGALLDDTLGGQDAGSAYVFIRTGSSWSQQAKLTASDGDVQDYFGFAVALSGDTALVGAYQDDLQGAPNAGSVYVFTRIGSTWNQQAQLTASDGGPDDYFGTSVALSGESALIGARGDSTPSETYAGSAYVFKRVGNSWIQEAKLVANDGASEDYFGVAVAISGDTALVGADGDDSPGASDGGSAYVFTRSSGIWTQQMRLSAGDAGTGDYFGSSVALTNDTAVVGAYANDTAAGVNTGTAYVFIRSGALWSQQAQLSASDAAANRRFGLAVTLSGNTVLCGAYAYDATMHGNVGAAYAFTRVGNLWTQQAKLTSGEVTMGGAVGYSVALSGDVALSGAFANTTSAGSGAGSAEVFERTALNWSHSAQLDAGNGATLDNFSDSLALSGDTVLVGTSSLSTPAGNGINAVYVFVRTSTGWILQARLFANDAVVADGFGTSVALMGDTAVVGAIGSLTSGGIAGGSAYVFVRNGLNWYQQAKLAPVDGAAQDLFGTSVAISNDTVLIGASGDDTAAGTDAGSAYIFVHTGGNWYQQARLSANDGAAGDRFGNSVSLSGNTALVGAWLDDMPSAVDAGSAYVFGRVGNTWPAQAKLTANDGAAGDWFGASVALAGDTALVGAPRDSNPDSGYFDFGSAYVFTRNVNVWTPETKLYAGDASSFDTFGMSVALSNDTALVGSPGDNNSAGEGAGACYLFTRSGNNWFQQEKFLAGDGAPSDGFGRTVALSGNTALVGSPWDDGSITGNQGVGSAYIYRDLFGIFSDNFEAPILPTAPAAARTIR